MKATLIISIYKNVKYLKAVLDSLHNQTIQNFEIIISEDGDDPEVSNFVSSYHFRQPFQYLTQPDEGWRKNRALNRAIVAANNQWLIFIDGDCLLHPRFIEMHLYMARPNRVLGGKRVKLDETTTNELLNVSDYLHSMQGILMNQILFRKGSMKYCDEGLFINPSHWLKYIIKFRKIKLLKGCNMSFSKESALLINGFDEDYILPAIGEDTDLTWRFKGLGFEQVSVRNLAVQYHLYHQESWTDQQENAKIQHQKQELEQYVCQNGIRKL